MGSQKVTGLIRLKTHIYVLKVAFLLLCIVASNAFAVEQKNITIVFASDMPLIANQQIGDYAELAAALSQKRALPGTTFFLFGGGSIGPSPMAAFDRGSHIIDVLNSLEPDAMGTTKREFSYFEDELSQRSYEAAFPIVASNVFDPVTGGNLDGLVDTAIISKGGIKLGIISLINQEVVREYLLERVQVLPPEQTLYNAARRLREQGANLVVLLYTNQFDFIASALESSAIDLAIFSEPHFNLASHGDLPKHANSLALINPGDFLDIQIQWKDNGEETFEIDWRELNLKDYTPDPIVVEQIQGYTARLNRLLNEEIGEFTTKLDTTRPTVRSRESAFGNLLADSLREFMATDIALINGGVIRGEKRYSRGDIISRRDIALELPFRSRVVVLEVTGAQLITALENGLSQIREQKGRFPQISGLKIEYDSSATSGNRILSVSHNNKRVKPSQLLTLATSDYLASGGDGYISLQQAKRANSSNRIAPMLADVLINKIRSERRVAPKVEGRLVDKSSD